MHFLEYRKVSIPMPGTKSTIVPTRLFLQPKKDLDYNYNIIETLIDEIKPVVKVTIEDEFSLNVKKIFKTIFFGNSGQTGILCNEPNQRFFTSILFYYWYVLGWVLDGGTRTCCGWGIQVWNSAKKSSIFLENSDCQDTDTKNTNGPFSHRTIVNK